MKAIANYDKNVFINCPFDSEYDAIFNAILFTVHKCGFVLRCAKEYGDSSKVRIKNIVDLIRVSRYSIHDLSRVGLDGPAKLPRFNMPLELGIFIGSMEFGPRRSTDREYLILESDQFRFKQFISDISGQDVKAHNDDPKKSVRCVRNWLASKADESIPSAGIIWEEYERFLEKLPELCKESRWLQDELTFAEYSSLVTAWLALPQSVVQ